MTKYGTSLEYSCGPGVEFEVSPGEPTVSSITLTCGWDGQWGPSDTLGTCKSRIELQNRRPPDNMYILHLIFQC